jgi:endoglucanase
MRTRLLFISILFSTFDSLYAGDSWVRINQLGYLPDAVKVAVFISEEDIRTQILI